jgi:DNA invertase Pin-like site-specific DNA recombinase
MSAVREYVPQGGAGPVRTAVYVRISTEHNQHSVGNQKSTIRRYADARQLHIAFIYSGRANAKSESRNQS